MTLKVVTYTALPELRTGIFHIHQQWATAQKVHHGKNQENSLKMQGGSRKLSHQSIVLTSGWQWKATLQM